MVGEKIKKLRLKQGYSLSELAERAGVSKSYLSYIERNVYKNPSLQFLSKLASTLETSIEYFLEKEPVLTKQVERVLDTEWVLLLKEAIHDGMSKQDLKEICTYLKYKKSIENGDEA
jgi:XRE family transcriptional regulator, master regulator for biofilm formation